MGDDKTEKSYLVIKKITTIKTGDFLVGFREKAAAIKMVRKISGSKVDLGRLIFYCKVWLKMSKSAFLVVLSHKTVLLIFLTGKILRFFLFAGFLYFLVNGAERLAGYGVNEAIFFFLTFNLVEVISGFLFREVYRFRSLLISGDFDLVLVKPMSSLFRVLLGGADIIDFITIPPLILMVVLLGKTLAPTSAEIIFYVLLVINGLIISTGFYILVLSMAILTLEIDHTIMILRDVVNLGRLPVDIYKQPLKGFLTYIIPVAIMVTLPAKAFIGLVSIWGTIFSFIFGAGVLLLSTRIWNLALKRYTSASS